MTESAMSDAEALRVFDVFLSHNSREKTVVERIAERLKREGVEPWLDKWCLTPGGDWQDELAEGLRRASSCAVFIGPCGIGNWERLELKLATQRMANDRDFHVFLVLLPDLPEPFDTSSLPPFLSTRTWVDLRKGVADPRAFQTLINAVKRVASGPETPIEPRNDVCPYRGLRAFDEQHAEFFFGREGDVQRLVEKLKVTRFLTVLGPSGSGKTSVLRAGLIPALQKGVMPDSDTWSIRVFAPGARPLTSLATNLVRLFPQLSAIKALDELGVDQRSLNMATSVARAECPQSQYMVWIVDQFEEVFTLCQDESERTKFIDNLLYAATVPGGRDVIILTMRADFYQKCAAYPELSALVAAHQFLVSPLSTDGLRQAIAEPAWRVGLEFEPGLVETILGDVEQQPGALPMLEHALLELWERRRGHLLTLQDYMETGGVAGAIAKRADAIFESLDAERQAIARRVLLRLTQPGDGTEDTRRRATLDELVTSSDEAERVRGVIAVLINARLLTVSGDAEGGPETVDVSHEALIRNWPRLRRWVDEDRQGLRTHRQLTEAAQEWQRAGRDEGLLFRGARLAQTVEWRERNPAALNDVEKEFLKASLEFQTRERLAAQRRTRRVVMGLITTIVLIGAASLVALNQSRLASQRGTEAFARELAANALAQLRANPELSLLLAIEAAKKAHSAETENTLRQVLGKSPLHVLHMSATGTTHNPTATFSHDSKLIVAASGKTLRVFDTESGRMLFERQQDLFLDNSVISPDGRFIASALTDTLDDYPNPNEPSHEVGLVQITETSTGRDVARLQTSSPGADMAFSPDNRFLVTPGEQSQVWEVGTWRAVAAVDGRDAAFSRDGRVLLTKSSEHVNKLFVTDVATWKRVAEIPTAPEGLGNPVFGALSPDGKHVVASTNDRRVRLYASGSGRMVRELKLEGAEGASVPQFSPDGLFVAFAVHGKAVMWDTGSGKTRSWSEMTKPIYDLSFSPDGRLLLTVSGSALLHDLHSGHILAEFPAMGSGIIMDAAFSPDGNFFLTTNDDGTVYLGDLNFWRARAIQETSAGGDESVTVSAAFSPNRKLLATITETRGGRSFGQVRELAGGRIVLSLTHPRDLTGLAFSPDGGLLLTTDDVAAQVWELGSGRVLSELPHGAGLMGAVYSPDGKLIATTGKGMLKIWDASSGQAVEEIPNEVEDTDAIAIFAPDSRHVLITTARQTRILEIGDSHAALEVGEEHETPTSTEAVYSPDGRYILIWERLLGLFTISSVRVLDADTGRVVVELNGHVGSVTSATFDPGSQYILTTSGFYSGSDERATVPYGADESRVWDLRTGSTFYEFLDPRGPVISGAFAPDGKSILVIDNYGTVFSYFCELCVPQDELLRLAQKRSVRQLTLDERARYLHEPRGD
jgi:WD40 repeat protein/ABC-type Fe3+/spermidine/putrescine transport system ATPase subunit